MIGVTPAMVETCMRGHDMADSTCSVDGCERLVERRGYCKAHFNRVLRHGHPQADKPVGFKVSWSDPKGALYARVQVTPSGCHQWTGSIHKGYGRATGGLAHVKSWELANGPVPDGMELDHLCRNRACINPDHLEPVTHDENVKRGLSGSAARARTHCPKGHAYDSANTYRDSRGWRSCKACFRAPKRAVA